VLVRIDFSRVIFTQPAFLWLLLIPALLARGFAGYPALEVVQGDLDTAARVGEQIQQYVDSSVTILDAPAEYPQ